MSKEKETVPFRFDIVGSFLRPEHLKEARAAFEKGILSAKGLKKVEDEVIIALVEKQKEVGLKAVTDGEFRRSWWHLDFMWGLEGVERTPIETGYQFQGETSRAETARLSGKIKFGNHPFLEHFTFLKSIAGDLLARQTIPAPAQFLLELDRAENMESTKQIYPDRQELLEDIANAYQEAVKAFYELGCRNLQLDDCTWGTICDQKFRELFSSLGLDLNKLTEEFIYINNKTIESAPSDMAVTTHVCRGNFHSTWAASGGYEAVAEPLFGEEKASAYYLEFDTERSGDFTPLRHVGENKKVVLGLVSSKTGKLEEKKEIIKRIYEASKYVPLKHICLSPQCGFASTEEGNILTEEQQWNKLRLIKEIAEEVWS